jgi:hypothetical protein
MESVGAVSIPRRSSLGRRLEFRLPGACGRPSKTPRKSCNSRPRQARENAWAIVSCSRDQHPIVRQAMPGPFCLREFPVRAEAGSRDCGRRQSCASRKLSRAQQKTVTLMSRAIANILRCVQHNGGKHVARKFELKSPTAQGGRGYRIGALMSCGLAAADDRADKDDAAHRVSCSRRHTSTSTHCPA